MMLDLHLHSSCSDGSYSPMQLVDMAVKNQIHLCALCDHDTFEGCEVFVTYGAKRGVTTIAGIEMSAQWENGTCHVLGLGLDTTYEPLEKLLCAIRQSRQERNGAILQKLDELGMHITMQDISLEAGGTVFSRVHIAMALIRKHYVETVTEAFKRYLGKGMPAYVDRYRLPIVDTVRILHESQAFVVLAHPSLLNLDNAGMNELLERLIPQGLSGIEVFSPHTLDSEINLYMGLCQKYCLFVTGGSDFHGESKPNNHMGFYRPDTQIPPLCAEGVYHQGYLAKV
ncbi:MAG: PHP domain-containing protein [Chitinivibrionales bacterium]|nr:PHP domain-containing protein [Chitinivibrionales bacterium]